MKTMFYWMQTIQDKIAVLAHISKDPTFIHALKTTRIYIVEQLLKYWAYPWRVTPEQRNDIKAVNFGIIYGISDFNMARNLEYQEIKLACI